MTECDFLSSWTLSWLDPLFAAAEKEGGIVMPDVWSLPESQQGDDIDERFSAAWDRECKRVEENGQGERPSILRALLSVFGWRFKYVAVYVILFDICLLSSPFFVSNLLDYVGDASDTSVRGYLLAFGLWLCFFTIGSCVTHMYFQTIKIGTNARAALQAAVYVSLCVFIFRVKTYPYAGQQIQEVSQAK